MGCFANEGAEREADGEKDGVLDFTLDNANGSVIA